MASERLSSTMKMKGHKDPPMLIYFIYPILPSKGYYSILFISQSCYAIFGSRDRCTYLLLLVKTLNLVHFQPLPEFQSKIISTKKFTTYLSKLKWTEHHWKYHHVALSAENIERWTCVTLSPCLKLIYSPILLILMFFLFWSIGNSTQTPPQASSCCV